MDDLQGCGIVRPSGGPSSGGPSSRNVAMCRMTCNHVDQDSHFRLNKHIPYRGYDEMGPEHTVRCGIRSIPSVYASTPSYSPGGNIHSGRAPRLGMACRVQMLRIGTMLNELSTSGRYSDLLETRSREVP